MGIRISASWLLVYSSCRTVGAADKRGQAEVHIPGSPCCLALALCPQKTCLPPRRWSFCSLVLLPLLSSPLCASCRHEEGGRLHTEAHNLVSTDQAASHEVKLYGWSPWKTDSPCPSLALSPGAVFTEMPNGLLGSSIRSSQEPVLRHCGNWSLVGIHATPTLWGLHITSCGIRGLSYKMGE